MHRLGNVRAPTSRANANKLCHLKWVGAVLTAAVLSFVSSSMQAETKQAKLIAKYEQAVVKLMVEQQGIEVDFGAGFFISKDGYLVTSSHVAMPAATAGFTLTAITKDGQRFKNVSILDCRDERKIDLCVLKLDYSPKEWFDPSALESIPKGEPIFAIGHPKGYDYTVSQGIISGYHHQDARFEVVEKKGADTVEMIQITAPISPGNSGGPIFDGDGQLIGVATWVRVDKGSQNLNFAISASEIHSYFEKRRAMGVTSFQAWKKARMDMSKKIADDHYKKVIRPQLAALKAGEAIDPKLFTYKTVKSGDRMYRFPLPSTFATGCKPSAARDADAALSCKDASGDLLYVRFSSAKPGAWKAMNGKRLEPEPLEIVKILQSEGRWEKKAKSLSDEQRKFLYSMPEPYLCEDGASTQPAGRAAAGAAEASTICTNMVYNDFQPDAASFTVTTQYESTGQVVAVTAWTSDSSSAAAVFPLTGIIMGGLSWSESEPSPAEIDSLVRKLLLSAYSQQKAYRAENGRYTFSYDALGIEPELVKHGIVLGFSRRCAEQYAQPYTQSHTQSHTQQYANKAGAEIAATTSLGRQPASTTPTALLDAHHALDTLGSEPRHCLNPKSGFSVLAVRKSASGAFTVWSIGPDRTIKQEKLSQDALK